MDNIELGKRLKQARISCNYTMEELELTQKDVAKMLNIAQATANQKINNVRPLTLVEAEKLCEILEISPSEFNIYFFTK